MPNAMKSAARGPLTMCLLFYNSDVVEWIPFLIDRKYADEKIEYVTLSDAAWRYLKIFTVHE